MPITAKFVMPLFQCYDMRRSVAFYCDKLGFEIDHQWEPDGHLYWAMLKLGGAFVMLNAEYEDDKRPTGPEYGKPRNHLASVYFLCDDVDGKYQELLAQGVDVKPPENAHYGERQLTVRDPDGFELVFHHPVK